MGPHSSTLAWKIPWTEEPGRLQSVHGVTKSQTWLSDFTFTFHFHASLEKEVATHSSVLTWRIPGTGEPGGLLSMGSHRVRHDWSDLSAAATFYAGFPGDSAVKNPPANAGDSSLILGLGRSPGEGNGNPLQYSCLRNPMDRGTWWATPWVRKRVGHNLAAKQLFLCLFGYSMDLELLDCQIIMGTLLQDCSAVWGRKPLHGSSEMPLRWCWYWRESGR